MADESPVANDGVPPALKPVGPDWLHAAFDPLAGVAARPSCVCTSDVRGDRDYRLVAACQDRKLRVIVGSRLTLEREVRLLDDPVAVASLFMDERTPRIPAIAVAAGRYIFMYRNLRPFFKFTLPAPAVDAAEKQAWKDAVDEKITPSALLEALTERRDSGHELTTLSAEFVALKDAPPDDEQWGLGGATKASASRRRPAAAAAAPAGEEDAQLAAFVRDRGAESAHIQLANAVTAMGTIKKDSMSDDALGQLVVGTERKQLFVLRPGGTEVELEVALPSVPTAISTNGMVAVSYRIAVACRDGRVYFVRNGRLSARVIDPPAPVIGLVAQERQAVVACMDGQLAAFSYAKGQRLWMLRMPARISCISRVTIESGATMDGVGLALSNGDTRIYNDNTLAISTGPSIDVIQEYQAMMVAAGKHPGLGDGKAGADAGVTTAAVAAQTGLVGVAALGGESADPIRWIRFGRMGREDRTLVSGSASGSVRVLVVPRQAKLTASNRAAGPPVEQGIPLPVPKKTRLYVQQTQREREESVTMHRVFQQELVRMRLQTVKAFVATLTEARGTSSSAAGAHLRATAEVLGLGPRFTLVMRLTNNGRSSQTDLLLQIVWNDRLYSVAEPLHSIPVLLPQRTVERRVEVRCVDPAGAPGARLQLLLVGGPGSSGRARTMPLLSAEVDMPQAMEEEEG